MTKMRNIIYEDYFDGEGIKGTDSERVGEPWIESWRSDLHV